MPRPLFRLSLVAVAVALAGCDALTHRKVLAAALVEVPGGFAGPTRLPGGVRAQLFLGERGDLDRLGSELPAGLTGARVTLTWAEDGEARTIALPPGADDGSYWEDGSARPELHYVPGATYTFRAVLEGEEYAATVVAPPRVRIRELDAAPDRVASISRAATARLAPPLTLTPAGAIAGDLGFYAAYRDPRGGPLDARTFDDRFVTCTNLPREGDSTALVDLLVDPAPLASRAFELAPSACFPDPGTYVVGLFAARKGTVTSNLFAGAVLAATGDAGAVAAD